MILRVQWARRGAWHYDGRTHFVRRRWTMVDDTGRRAVENLWSNARCPAIAARQRNW